MLTNLRSFEFSVGASDGGLITGRRADAAGGDYTHAFYSVIAVRGLALVLTLTLEFLSRGQLKRKTDAIL